jgi:hypothetical protein
VSTEEVKGEEGGWVISFKKWVIDEEEDRERKPFEKEWELGF